MLAYDIHFLQGDNGIYSSIAFLAVRVGFYGLARLQLAYHAKLARGSCSPGHPTRPTVKAGTRSVSPFLHLHMQRFAQSETLRLDVR